MAGLAYAYRGRLRAVTLCLIAALALSACAKRDLYPGERRPDNKVALIEAERFLMARVEYTIDGTNVGSMANYYLPPGVGDSWFLGGPRKGAGVLPGQHTIDAKVWRFGFVTASETACASLTFDAVADAHYKLFIQDGILDMRESASGDQVAKATFQACPQKAATEPKPGAQSSSNAR
ncbi:MAG: hypothetical protein AAF942_11870 [Pseudomonadota bacterium]